MSAVYKSLAKASSRKADNQSDGVKKDDQSNGVKKNKQRVLILSSRGVTHRYGALVSLHWQDSCRTRDKWLTPASDIDIC